MKRKNSNTMYPPEFLTNLATSSLKGSFFVSSIKMDIYKKLNKKILSVSQFSKILKIPVTSGRALAQNLSNMGLLIFKNGYISNSKIAKQYLVEDETTKQLMLWLSDYSPRPEELINILRNPPPQPWYSIQDQKKYFFSKFKSKPIDSAFYTDPHELRIRWGKELAEKYDFTNHKRLLDLGGACGGWTVGILERYQTLEACVFERPDIGNITKSVLKKHSRSINKRIDVITGDFLKDLPPLECDVVLIANVLHDWSLRDCERILYNVISSVKEDATFLINEFYFSDDWRDSDYGALQAMLVLGPENKSGWQPSFGEMKLLLARVGLKKIRKMKNLLIASK